MMTEEEIEEEGRKLLPVTVMTVPPLSDPDEGEIENTVGTEA
jgi:hypothetical protein